MDCYAIEFYSNNSIINSYKQSCPIKTNIRPDGNVIKYFNPQPVVQNNKYDLAISLYLNETSRSYYLSIAVLFKQMSFRELNGNLIIQTNSDFSLNLNKVSSDKVIMNGEVLAVGMYELSVSDVEILKAYSLKSVFVNLNGDKFGDTILNNKNIIISEFICFDQS